MNPRPPNRGTWTTVPRLMNGKPHGACPAAVMASILVASELDLGLGEGHGVVRHDEGRGGLRPRFVSIELWAWEGAVLAICHQALDESPPVDRDPDSRG